uniref:Sperm microtubule inner protein 1 C-terminal domain-containing protein n=1 Tax=Heliothis virescens TaxID=7102 RepID=A0A2A4K270_HELVI
MPFDDTDPRVQQFLIERHIQDNLHVMRWFLKHKDEMIRRAQSTENTKYYTDEQIRKTAVEANIKSLSKQHEASSRHRRRTAITGSVDATALNPFTMKTDEPSVMKPVDPQESGILYKQLASGGGRKAYLHMRKYKLPEEKYNDCVTSNVYGWALKESLIGISAPKHRRYATFTRDIARHSGVHPDPPHYEPPTERYYKKCIGFE